MKRAKDKKIEYVITRRRGKTGPSHMLKLKGGRTGEDEFDAFFGE